MIVIEALWPIVASACIALPIAQHLRWNALKIFSFCIGLNMVFQFGLGH